MAYNLYKFKQYFLNFDRGLGSVANYSNGTPVTEDVDKVIFIGYPTEEYNCIGFALGIEKFMGTDNLGRFEEVQDDDLSGGEGDEDTVDPTKLIRYFRKRETPASKVAEILPALAADESFNVIEVYFDEASNKVKLTDNKSEYVPQYQDVGLFQTNYGSRHMCIYTDIDSILVEFLYTAPGTTTPLKSVTLGSKWYSKCGEEYLVAHSLERLCSTSTEAKILDFTKVTPIATSTNPTPATLDLLGKSDAMGGVFNRNSYASIKYIFRKK
jgi:hypothetical protein